MSKNNSSNQKAGDHQQPYVIGAFNLGFVSQWAKDIESCTEASGTSFFPLMVQRFRRNIPDFEGAPLKSMIDEVYHLLFNVEYKDALNAWKHENYEICGCEAHVLRHEDELAIMMNQRLYEYMLQVLVDYGFTSAIRAAGEEQKE